MHNQKLNIFWFRRDLRLEDNTGLFHALSSDLPVLPIFIFDTDILSKLNDSNDKRIQFIYDNLCLLKKELNNFGSDLSIFYGKPIDIFTELVKSHSITEVFTNRDYEPYAKNRDKEVHDFLNKNNIGFNTFKDHVIFEGLEIAKDNGTPYKVYTPYQRKWKEKIQSAGVNNFASEKLKDNFIRTPCTPIPTLVSMGFNASITKYPPLKFDKEKLKNYADTRNYPALDGTSKLSVHLRHGTVSIRKAVQIARNTNETWLNQLIWRDFYIMILDNFPEVVNNEFDKRYAAIPWKNDAQEFQKWCEGKTGFPIVDAGMRELNESGYMHNRVRMITASFLTKHLLIDWRWGEAYFAEKLLDFELANNNGGWQWAAGCGTDAQPYFRIFNPYEQAKKFDPKNNYIKRWLPEINSKNHPQPIIDHKFARERAIQTFKKALQK